jgi:hypothetical protein
MIIGNVVFFNFIVAVVSESYEKSMQEMTVRQAKLKCLLIHERESIMSNEELKNRDYFPDYILVQQPARNLDGEDSGELWMGFVKDIKRSMT